MSHPNECERGNPSCRFGGAAVAAVELEPVPNSTGRSKANMAKCLTEGCDGELRVVSTWKATRGTMRRRRCVACGTETYSTENVVPSAALTGAFSSRRRALDAAVGANVRKATAAVLQGAARREGGAR
jgi:hypothetical protein